MLEQVFTNIDHVGIATDSIDQALLLYTDTFGMRLTFREVVAQQGTEVAFLQCGDSAVELLEPVDTEGALARFLAERGPGMHHIAYRVLDLETALRHCAHAGLTLIDEHARTGAGGHLVAFLHPRDTGRVLIELVERQHPSPAQAGAH